MKNISLLITLLALLGMTACTPVRETHGNFLKNHDIQAVQIGVDTRTEIVQKLGSPTTIAPFDDKVWYYLGQKTVKKGIFDAKVADERVTMVQFNEEGFVVAINDIDQNRLDIPLNDNKTHTGGNEVTAIQQLLGNLGRFNTPHEVNSR
ncbi:MAG: outer membrane protein assembly factor BamE [Bdellovibrionales bacterium]